MATKTCNITRKASLIPTWSQKLFADISIEGSQELWNEADIYSHAHHWRSTVCMGLLFPSAFSSSSRSTLQLNLHKLTQTHWRVWLHHITLYCTHHSIVTCVEWGRSTLKSSWSSSASVMCVCVCVGGWVWVCGCGCVGVGVWVCVWGEVGGNHIILQSYYASIRSHCVWPDLSIGLPRCIPHKVMEKTHQILLVFLLLHEAQTIRNSVGKWSIYKDERVTTSAKGRLTAS